MRTTGVFLLALAALAGVSAVESQPADATPEDVKQALEQGVRGILEPALRSRAGVGFRSFECEVPPDFGPGRRFQCEAIDEEGDWLGYAIRVEEDGTATVDLASERASELDSESRATLEAPCRRFLERYQAREWDALVADLHPALREKETLESARADLREVRELLGDVTSTELELHAVHESGRQELVYGVTCAHGRASARFGVEPDDAGVWRVIAFLVSAPPGSREQAVLLERVARRNLSEIVGTQVKEIDAPLERLVRPGDAVEGEIQLEGGRRMPVRIAQTGWKDDFDPVDYRFSILDVEWLVRRALAKQLPDVVTVECAAPVVPDGGEIGCTAIGRQGEPLDLVVSRSGGEHRMHRRTSPGK